MTSAPAVAAVDWGTSALRVWLFDGAGAVLAEERSPEGMQRAREIGFRTVFDRILASLGAPSDLPAIICGMAGARQGWIEAPYVDVPAALDAVLSAAVPVPGLARDVRIIPGMAQRDAAAPDVMRGEETQLAGTTACFGGGRVLVCLPGTHSKWVEVENGAVRRFRTYITGDHFAALAGHTILQHSLGDAAPVAADQPAFAEGVAAALTGAGDIGPSLFSVRAGGLLFGRAADASAAYLSGLLIGAEIASAARMHAAGRAPVTLIASGRLRDLYVAALAQAGHVVAIADADASVRAGLLAAAQHAGFVGAGT